MYLTSLYYRIKPYLPARLRLGLRRILAQSTRSITRDVWPIRESSAKKPVGWPGWPNGKQFAFVIVHDVEGQSGLDKCRSLMNLEQSLGFCSGFNLIPEGGYRVPANLRGEMIQRGCEVGVHDLHHDGKLYRNRKEFSENALRINEYLHEWEAVGFRSAFMLNRLDWLHELNITYDSSTFDTDPFEPQPEGRDTIFPFWVPRPASGLVDSQPSTLELAKSRPVGVNPHLSTLNYQPSTSRNGYVELPYTLAQDSTLFLLLREQTPEIWLRKLDWIARHGGMAIIGVHPDYIAFDKGSSGPFTYPEKLYKDFLLSLKETYAGAYWNCRPRDVAEFFAQTVRRPSEPQQVPQVQRR